MTKLHKQTALAAINHIASIVNPKNTIPILGNVLVNVTPTNVTFVGTDLDIEVTVNVPCESDCSFETTVKASDLKAAFGKSKDAIDMELDGNFLKVSFGSTKFNFATLPPEDFPIIASSEYDTEFEMSGSIIADQMSQASVAASDEETRYYLNGVYWHSVDGMIQAVATNGHKLIKVGSEVEQDITGIIIPTKTVLELSKIDTEKVTVSVSETKVRFSFGDVTIVSKVIDGTFPDYMRVIPSNLTSQMAVNGKDLKDAIATAFIIADGRSKAVVFDVTENTVTVSAKGPNGDEATVDVDCAYNGDEMKIGFSGKFVVDVTGQISDGDVVFEFGGPMDAAKIVSSSGDGFLGVIMPMRV